MKLTPILGIFALLAPLTSQASPLVNTTNLLSGLAATPTNVAVSSIFNPVDYAVAFATDGDAATDFVFAQDLLTPQLFAITGFNSSISSIVLWTGNYGDLAPSEVTIYSSTSSQTSLDSSDYNLLVATTTLGYANFTFDPADVSPNFKAGYYVFDLLSAPAGTKSLLFNFGVANGGAGYSGNGFARITELQAFAAVPEPSSLALLGLGMGAMILTLRNRRAKTVNFHSIA